MAIATNPKKKKKTRQVSLRVCWELRAKLRAEGAKRWAEGDKLRAEGDKLRAEGTKRRAEGAKRWAEGTKLRAEGDKRWAESVLEAFGNITLTWEWVKSAHDSRCTLDTGEVFEPIVRPMATDPEKDAKS